MHFAWLHDPVACVELTARLVGWSALTSASENLVAWRHFADDGILGWPVVKRRSRLRGNGLALRTMAHVFRVRGYVGTQIVRAAAAGALIAFAGQSIVRPGALFLLLVINLLTHLRHFPLASTGGDRMRLIVLGALALRELTPHSQGAAYAMLAFVAGQCALSYFVAGMAKLNKREWQTGTALSTLLRSPLMGDPDTAEWLQRHPIFCNTLTWAVLVLELGFPLALFAGFPIAIIFVVLAWTMHLTIGHLMGLTPFVWSFLATYPAVLLIGHEIAGWLWR